MRMGQVGRPFQRFCPFSSLSPPPGNGGLNLLVWVNMQGGHGLQKPELETARKEDLYIRAVRIVARDGGLGPAGDGGLNEKDPISKCSRTSLLAVRYFVSLVCCSGFLRMLSTCKEGRSSAPYMFGSVVTSESTNETSSFAGTYFRSRRMCDQVGWDSWVTIKTAGVDNKAT